LRFLQRYGPKSDPTDMRHFADLDEPPQTRSALSAPENFIAEAPLRRMFRRHRWLLIASAIAPVAVAGYVALRTDLLAGLDRRPVRTSVPAPPQGQSEEAKAADSRNGGGHSAPSVAPAQAAKPQASQPSVATTLTDDLRKRLATSGLPDQAVDPLLATDAKVTAFPPETAFAPTDRPASDAAESKPPVAPIVEKPEQASAPPPKPETPAPERDSVKLNALVARGEQLLASGEIAAARLFFQRAATDGDARGARGLARTYDEKVLESLSVRGFVGNRAEAQRWYLKAAELEADQTRSSASQPGSRR
jgi:hypothetical protein